MSEKTSTEPEKTKEEIEFEKLSSFFDKYINNNKLIVKYASLLGLERVMYVKGKDLKQFFEENFEEINKEIQSILGIDIGKESSEKSLQKFYEINQSRGIMHYLQRIQGSKAKYPKRLLPLKKTDDISKELIFNENGFYSLLIKVEKTNKPIIYLVLLILLILFVVLFPVYPLKFQIGVIWAILCLLIFLIVFLLLTIVISVIGLIFGYDIYILPNIDEVKMSWRDRLFNPFVAYYPREDDWVFKLFRIFFGFSIVSLSVIAYFYPTIPKESYALIKRISVSLFMYVKSKIVDMNKHKNAVSISEQKLYEEIDNL